MTEAKKKQFRSWAVSGVIFLIGNTAVLSTVWMLLGVHVDNYIDKRIDMHHKQDSEVIRLGIVVDADGGEWYLGPDGKRHSVIYGGDGYRWWFANGEMHQIYK